MRSGIEQLRHLARLRDWAVAEWETIVEGNRCRVLAVIASRRRRYWSTMQQDYVVAWAKMPRCAHSALHPARVAAVERLLDALAGGGYDTAERQDSG